MKSLKKTVTKSLKRSKAFKHSKKMKRSKTMKRSKSFKKKSIKRSKSTKKKSPLFINPHTACQKRVTLVIIPKNESHL